MSVRSKPHTQPPHEMEVTEVHLIDELPVGDAGDDMCQLAGCGWRPAPATVGWMKDLWGCVARVKATGELVELTMCGDHVRLIPKERLRDPVYVDLD